MRVVKIAATAALLSLSFGSFAEENNDAPAAQTAVQSNSSFGYISADVFFGTTKVDYSFSGALIGSTTSETLNRRGIRLGIGSKSATGFSYDVYFEGEDADDADNVFIGIGGSIKKSFGEVGEVQPFIKAGFSFGSTELDNDATITYAGDATQDYVNILAGFGIEKRIDKNTEVQFGFEFGHRAWDDIQLTDGFNTVTAEMEDSPKAIFIGLKRKI